MSKDLNIIEAEARKNLQSKLDAHIAIHGGVGAIYEDDDTQDMETWRWVAVHASSADALPAAVRLGGKKHDWLLQYEGDIPSANSVSVVSSASSLRSDDEDEEGIRDKYEPLVYDYYTSFELGV